MELHAQEDFNLIDCGVSKSDCLLSFEFFNYFLIGDFSELVLHFEDILTLKMNRLFDDLFYDAFLFLFQGIVLAALNLSLRLNELVIVLQEENSELFG